MYTFTIEDSTWRTPSTSRYNYHLSPTLMAFDHFDWTDLAQCHHLHLHGRHGPHQLGWHIVIDIGSTDILFEREPLRA